MLSVEKVFVVVVSRLLMLVFLPEYQVEGTEGVVGVLAQVREIPRLPDMEEAVREGVQYGD